MSSLTVKKTLSLITRFVGGLITIIGMLGGNLAYASNPPVPSPDCNGNGISDSTDIANDPSIDCNNNGLIDSCEFNYALKLHDTQADRVAIPHHPDMQIMNNQVTISFWVKFQTLPTNFAELVYKGDGTETGRSFTVWVVNADPNTPGDDKYFTLSSSHDNTPGNVLYLNTPVDSVTTSTWYHYAAVVDRIGGQARVHLWKEGVGDIGTWTSSITQAPSKNSSTHPLTVGGDRESLAGTYGIEMEATLDELRIWNVARTETQIDNLRSTRIDVTQPVEIGLRNYYNFDEPLEADYALDWGWSVNDGVLEGWLLGNIERVPSDVPLIYGATDNNGNERPDSCDIEDDPSLDLDEDGVLDSIQIAQDPSLDCDGNGYLDAYELDLWEDGTMLLPWSNWNGPAPTFTSIYDNDIGSTVVHVQGTTGNHIATGYPWQNDPRSYMSFTFKGSVQRLIVSFTTADGTKEIQYNHGSGTDYLSGNRGFVYTDENLTDVTSYKTITRNVKADWAQFGQAPLQKIRWVVFVPNSAQSSQIWIDEIRFTADANFEDCNQNGVPDSCDINSQASEDFNNNGIPDECDILLDPDLDEDANGKLDTQDISEDSGVDQNSNGTLDTVEMGLVADFRSGINSSIGIGNDSRLAFTSEFTIAHWFRIDSFTDTTYQTLVTKGGESDGAINYATRLYNDGTLHFIVEESGSLNTFEVSTIINKIELERWYHVIGVVDRTENEMKLYINGVEVESINISGLADVFTSTAPLQFGRTGYHSSGYNSLEGQLDDVQVWSRAITDSTDPSIEDLMGSVDPREDGLVGYWKFHDPLILNTVYNSAIDGDMDENNDLDGFRNNTRPGFSKFRTDFNLDDFTWYGAQNIYHPGYPDPVPVGPIWDVDHDIPFSRIAIGYPSTTSGGLLITYGRRPYSAFDPLQTPGLFNDPVDNITIDGWGITRLDNDPLDDIVVKVYYPDDIVDQGGWYLFDGKFISGLPSNTKFEADSEQIKDTNENSIVASTTYNINQIEDTISLRLAKITDSESCLLQSENDFSSDPFAGGATQPWSFTTNFDVGSPAPTVIWDPSDESTIKVSLSDDTSVNLQTSADYTGGVMLFDVRMGSRSETGTIATDFDVYTSGDQWSINHKFSSVPNSDSDITPDKPKTYELDREEGFESYMSVYLPPNKEVSTSNAAFSSEPINYYIDIERNVGEVTPVDPIQVDKWSVNRSPITASYSNIVNKYTFPESAGLWEATETTAIDEEYDPGSGETVVVGTSISWNQALGQLTGKYKVDDDIQIKRNKLYVLEVELSNSSIVDTNLEDFANFTLKVGTNDQQEEFQLQITDSTGSNVDFIPPYSLDNSIRKTLRFAFVPHRRAGSGRDGFISIEFNETDPSSNASSGKLTIHSVTLFEEDLSEIVPCYPRTGYTSIYDEQSDTKYFVKTKDGESTGENFLPAGGSARFRFGIIDPDSDLDDLIDVGPFPTDYKDRIDERLDKIRQAGLNTIGLYLYALQLYDQRSPANGADWPDPKHTTSYLQRIATDYFMRGAEDRGIAVMPFLFLNDRHQEGFDARELIDFLNLRDHPALLAYCLSNEALLTAGSSGDTGLYDTSEELQYIPHMRPFDPLFHEWLIEQFIADPNADSNNRLLFSGLSEEIGFPENALTMFDEAWKDNLLNDAGGDSVAAENRIGNFIDLDDATLFHSDGRLYLADYDAAPFEYNIPTEMEPGETITIILKFRNLGTERWDSVFKLQGDGASRSANHPLASPVDPFLEGHAERGSGGTPLFLKYFSIHGLADIDKFATLDTKALKFIWPITARYDSEGNFISQITQQEGQFVGPQEIAEFRFDITAPLNPGNYTIGFKMKQWNHPLFGKEVMTNIEVKDGADSTITSVSVDPPAKRRLALRLPNEGEIQTSVGYTEQLADFERTYNKLYTRFMKDLWSRRYNLSLQKIREVNQHTPTTSVQGPSGNPPLSYQFTAQNVPQVQGGSPPSPYEVGMEYNASGGRNDTRVGTEPTWGAKHLDFTGSEPYYCGVGRIATIIVPSAINCLTEGNTREHDIPLELQDQTIFRWNMGPVAGVGRQLSNYSDILDENGNPILDENDNPPPAYDSTLCTNPPSDSVAYRDALRDHPVIVEVDVETTDGSTITERTITYDPNIPALHNPDFSQPCTVFNPIGADTKRNPFFYQAYIQDFNEDDIEFARDLKVDAETIWPSDTYVGVLRVRFINPTDSDTFDEVFFTGQLAVGRNFEEREMIAWLHAANFTATPGGRGVAALEHGYFAELPEFGFNPCSSLNLGLVQAKIYADRFLSAIEKTNSSGGSINFPVFDYFVDGNQFFEDGTTPTNRNQGGVIPELGLMTSDPNDQPYKGRFLEMRPAIEAYQEFIHPTSIPYATINGSVLEYDPEMWSMEGHTIAQIVPDVLEYMLNNSDALPTLRSKWDITTEQALDDGNAINLEYLGGDDSLGNPLPPSSNEVDFTDPMQRPIKGLNSEWNSVYIIDSNLNRTRVYDGVPVALPIGDSITIELNVGNTGEIEWSVPSQYGRVGIEDIVSNPPSNSNYIDKFFTQDVPAFEDEVLTQTLEAQEGTYILRCYLVDENSREQIYFGEAFTLQINPEIVPE
jgi:hypothetical protein